MRSRGVYFGQYKYSYSNLTTVLYVSDPARYELQRGKVRTMLGGVSVLDCN